MDHYKKLLLALGLTISGTQIVDAGDASLSEERGEIPAGDKKGPSVLFLEMDADKDKALDDWNVGCSVSNSSCQ